MWNLPLTLRGNGASERGGEGLGVVTGFQTRDSSARVTWVGGVELFSDAYVNKKLPSCVERYSSPCTVFLTLTFFSFSGEKPGNEQFARDIATWTFQENLVLHVDSTSHHLRNETTPRDEYTINDNIVCYPFPANELVKLSSTKPRPHRSMRHKSPATTPSADGQHTPDWTICNSSLRCSTRTSARYSSP